MIRLLDILISGILILVFLIPLFIFSIIILFSDGLPIIFYSKRVGQNNIIFDMPKFRTMKKNTPQLATHLMHNPNDYLLPYSNFYRKSSIDELPQLFSVFFGKMSLIGPRPALFNQNDLILLRSKYGIDQLKPGITGLAQVSGRDNLTIEEKVKIELIYLNNNSLFLNFKILFKTLFILFKIRNVKH